MKFDDFDYEDGDLEAKLCLEWGFDAGSLSHYRKAATNMYQGACQGKRVFVKVTAGSIRPERDIEGATAFLRHLSEKDAPVSKLVVRADGERYGFFDQGEASYFVTVIEEVEGEALTYAEDDPTKFMAWGEALAQVHNGADDFDGSPYPYLTGEGEWIRSQERLADQDDVLLKRIEEIGAWREGLPKPVKGFPVTHGDMNAGNLIWDGTSIGIIDFEEPMYTWNAADMARPFRETQEMSDERRNVCFDAFMNGYKKHRTPQFFDPMDYSNFVTLKNLEMYGWGLKEWEGETAFDGGDLKEALEQLRGMILEPLSLG